jgi:N-formylglutamate deformylase
MTDSFTLHRGRTPLLVSVPHTGTTIPPGIAERLVPRALAVEDTDWHLDQIYDFAKAIGASLIVPRYSRYVIDLNRPAENTPMYPGVNNTELCPTRFFTGDPLYQPGRAPQPEEIAQRLARYWQPYHAALQAELQRLKAEHGHALLWDGHSIQPELPWLFNGRLPDLNLGTVNGESCAPGLRNALQQTTERQRSFSHVIDGRFKGGYITRHYGRPGEGVHAVQMEMCFTCYMNDTPPWTLDPQRVSRLRPVLQALLETMLAWRPK